MVAAITSGSTVNALSPGAAVAGLEAQLIRYQKQLSDCVNCASAKTPEGKANIEALTTKINDVKQRIDQVPKTKADRSAPANDAATATEPEPRQTRRNDDTASVGRLIDTFA